MQFSGNIKKEVGGLENVKQNTRLQERERERGTDALNDTQPNMEK